MSRFGKRKTWVTPVSTVGPLHFERLTDEEVLSIIVRPFQGDSPDEKPEICFKWAKPVAYKCTLEEHGVPWQLDGTSVRDNGATHFVDDSYWLIDLKTGNDLLDLYAPNALHFVILTDLYVVEIIANELPEIHTVTGIASPTSSV